MHLAVWISHRIRINKRDFVLIFEGRNSCSRRIACSTIRKERNRKLYINKFEKIYIGRAIAQANSCEIIFSSHGGCVVAFYHGEERVVFLQVVGAVTKTSTCLGR